MTIEFFGAVDKNSKGEVAAPMPAWFQVRHIEEMEVDISKQKGRIERGEIEGHGIQIAKQDIANKEQRLKEIRMSKPKFKGSEKDLVAKTYHDIKNKIADSLPSRLDTQKGLVKPMVELARLNNYEIAVNPEIAKACNVKTVNGKVTGKGASIIFKMTGASINEETDVERIRKEGRSEAQHSMEEFTTKILEKFANGVPR